MYEKQNKVTINTILGCLEAIPQHLHGPDLHSAAHGWAQPRWPPYGWYSKFYNIFIHIIYIIP